MKRACFKRLPVAVRFSHRVEWKWVVRSGVAAEACHYVIDRTEASSHL